MVRLMTDSEGTADPVSWLLIRPGWKVVAADGAEVGAVDEVAGDSSEDIFDGLAVAFSAFGKPRYVPAEQVGVITDGVVHLTIGRAQAEQLGEYLEPATSARIDPEGGRIGAELRGLESRFVDPPQKHAHPVNVWRRLSFALRRLVSRS
jgi:hypothetical protein